MSKCNWATVVTKDVVQPYYIDENNWGPLTVNGLKRIDILYKQATKIFEANCV